MKNVDTLRERERESSNLNNKKTGINKCPINNENVGTGRDLSIWCKKIMSNNVGVDHPGDPQTKQKQNTKSMSNVVGTRRALSENTGITLVALIITIIVLLILAGVTLSMTIGPSGIFTKAKNAKEEMQYSQELEALKLAVLDAKIEDVDASFEELIEVLKNDPKYTYIINNTKQLAEISDNGEIKAFGDITGNTIYVIPEKYEFGIDDKLNIIEPENKVASNNSSQSSQEEQTEGEDRIVKTLKVEEQYRIESGEHDGHEIVQAADLASQTSGEGNPATAEDILKDKIAYVDGKKVVGTLDASSGGSDSSGNVTAEKGDILWRNPNPTASFAAQNITLSQNITQYSHFILKWTVPLLDTHYEEIYKVEVDRILTANAPIYSISGRNSANNNSMSRGFWYVDETHLGFGGAFYQNKVQTVNQTLVPEEIYGVNITFN